MNFGVLGLGVLGVWGIGWRVGVSWFRAWGLGFVARARGA